MTHSRNIRQQIAYACVCISVCVSVCNRVYVCVCIWSDYYWQLIWLIIEYVGKYSEIFRYLSFFGSIIIIYPFLSHSLFLSLSRSRSFWSTFLLFLLIKHKNWQSTTGTDCIIYTIGTHKRGKYWPKKFGEREEAMKRKHIYIKKHI